MIKRLSPYKITFIFVIVGLAWIFFSDYLVESLFSFDLVLKIQKIKGSLFIVITALLLFYLTRIYQKQLLKNRKQILQNEKRYRRLINQAPVGIIVHRNGRIIFANQKILELVGASSMLHIIGERIISFIEKKHWKVISYMEKELLIHQKVPAREIILAKKNGKEIAVELSSVLIEYQDEMAVQTIIQDITERKNIERDLRENEQKLKEAQLLGKMGSWEWNVGAHRSQWSDQMFRIFNRPLSEGQPTIEEIISYILPEDREKFIDLSQQAIKEGKGYNYDFRLIGSNDEVRYVNDVCKPITDKNGKIIRLEGITLDITDRKKVELRLKTSEEKLKEAQKLGKTGHWSLNVKTRELNWSEQMHRLYQDSLKATCPKIDDISALIHPDDKPMWKKAVNQLLENGKPYNIVFRIVDKNEQTCYINEIAEPVFNDNGKVVEINGVAIDITERKKAEIKQEESEQKYKKLVDTIPDGVSLHDTEGKYLFLNKAAAGFLNGKPEDFIGRSISSVHKRLVARFFMDIIQQVKETGKGWANEAKLGKHWYILNVEPLFQEQGQNMRILSVVTDITEQKNTQLQLEKSKSNLSNAQRMAKIGSWNLDLKTNSMFWSDMLYNLLGLEKKVVQPSLEKLFEMIHPEDKDSTRLKYETLLKGIGKAEIEHRFITPKGKQLHVYQIGEITYDKTGKPIRIDGTIQDISERVQSEKALKKAFAQLESYTNAMNRSALVAITDLNGRLLHVNSKFCELSGFRKEEFLGETFNFMNSKFYTEAFYKRMFQILRRGDTWRGEIKNQAKDGNIFWIDMVVNPIYNEEGSIDRFLAISYEITDRKQNEEKLAQSNRELETFLYKASHDLKGPLTTMNGLINITKHEVKDTHLQQLLSLMEERSRHLKKTLDELVEISNIRQGQLHYTAIDFDQIIAEITQQLQDRYKNAELVIQTKIEIKPPFYGDKHLLKLMFLHMLDNSVKYSSESKVSNIDIKILSLGEHLKINIQDNGLGIPLHMQEQVFDMYFRGNERSKGAGLGLYIVKTIVERLEGEIYFTSMMGKGTTFSITLPRVSEVASGKAA